MKKINLLFSLLLILLFITNFSYAKDSLTNIEIGAILFAPSQTSNTLLGLPYAELSTNIISLPFLKLRAFTGVYLILIVPIFSFAGELTFELPSPANYSPYLGVGAGVLMSILEGINFSNLIYEAFGGIKFNTRFGKMLTELGYLVPSDTANSPLLNQSIIYLRLGLEF